jgi:hypothetical protein
MAFRPVPAAPPREVNAAIESFKQGVITLIDEASLPLEASTEARNLVQVQDGRWKTRPGTANYGADAGAEIDGAFEYRKSDGLTELLVIASGTAKKAQDGAAWTTITGGTYASGTRVRGKQINNRLYLVDGTSNLSYYNGVSGNISSYTNVSAPSGASGIVRGSGLATGTNTVSYKIVAINDVGFTTPSNAITGTVNIRRNSWSATAQYIDLSWTPPTASSGSVRRYEIYYADQVQGSAATGFEVYLDSVASDTTTYRDDGTAQPNGLIDSPIDNTTVGPKFAQMELSGNRIWATKDSDNPYRVYWSGTGPEIGVFSSYYDGGYVDIEKGGREYPIAVVPFRDGRGNAIATVITSNPEGTGSIWQVELVSTTIGDVTFNVPNTTKIVSGVGSTAPDSVVAVGDAIHFGNKRGWFSLGSRPSLLNVLATNELSANIRPFWRGLTGSAMENVCAYYRDGKVYISYPYGATQNNRIGVFDLEQRNWNPEAFSFGVKQFLEYTDTGEVTRFLAVPYGSNYLIEISDNYQGDNGVAFNQSYASGLYPVARDRTKFAKINKVYVDFGNLQGEVNIEFLGTDKKRGFRSLSSVTVTDTTSFSNSGWGTETWGVAKWGTSSNEPASFALSTKRVYLKINKLIHNWKIRVTASALNTTYTIQRVMTKGFLIPTRDPSSWKAEQ